MTMPLVAVISVVVAAPLVLLAVGAVTVTVAGRPRLRAVLPLAVLGVLFRFLDWFGTAVLPDTTVVSRVPAETAGMAALPPRAGGAQPVSVLVMVPRVRMAVVARVMAAGRVVPGLL